MDNREKEIALDLRPFGVPEDCSFERLIMTDEEGFTVENVKYQASGRDLNISLKEYSSIVLRMDR